MSGSSRTDDVAGIFPAAAVHERQTPLPTGNHRTPVGLAASGQIPWPATGLLNDEMIAAERRYTAAVSVADLTDGTAELALAAAPRT